MRKSVKQLKASRFLNLVKSGKEVVLLLLKSMVNMSSDSDKEFKYISISFVMFVYEYDY